jgi:putative ABC transport system permease protein
VRWSLFDEIIRMSVDTLRANKMRSALTVLGIVIGITSIVGMTALIRGFDQSLRDSIQSLGPDTITVAKFSGISMASGADFQDLLMRPNMAGWTWARSTSWSSRSMRGSSRRGSTPPCAPGR